MAARLGRALYWIGSATAVLILMLAERKWLDQDPENDSSIAASLTWVGVAVIAWLVGSACRHLLTEPQRATGRIPPRS